MTASSLYRWLLTIGFLPLVMLCATGNRASASCGDYLHIVSDKPQTQNDDTPNQPRPPCNGPSCHQSPATPAPTPITVTVTEHQTSDAILTASAEVIAIQTAVLTDAVFSVCHVPADAIFHPPRGS